MTIGLIKLMRGIRNFMDEIKIMQRGSYYLTPFNEDHVYEFVHVIHPENVREIYKLGHTSVIDALKEMTEMSEVYLVRDGQGEIVFVGGLLFDQKIPQMFAMFSSKLKSNFTVLARGSKMLINFFDQSYPSLSMTIQADYEAMLNWAAWLGFEPVCTAEYKNTQYVEFVRCNPVKNYVSHETSRPVMH